MKKFKSKLKTEAVKVYKFDTKVGVFEKKFDIELGVNPNMKLGKFLEKKGYPSLAAMLKNE